MLFIVEARTYKLCHSLTFSRCRYEIPEHSSDAIFHWGLAYNYVIRFTRFSLQVRNTWAFLNAIFCLAWMYKIHRSFQLFRCRCKLPGIRQMPFFVAGLDVRNTSFAFAFSVAGANDLSIMNALLLWWPEQSSMLSFIEAWTYEIRRSLLRFCCRCWWPMIHEYFPSLQAWTYEIRHSLPRFRCRC